MVISLSPKNTARGRKTHVRNDGGKRSFRRKDIVSFSGVSGKRDIVCCFCFVLFCGLLLLKDMMWPCARWMRNDRIGKAMNADSWKRAFLGISWAY